MQHEYTIIRPAMLIPNITLAQHLLYATVIAICNLVVISPASYLGSKCGDYRVDASSYIQDLRRTPPWPTAAQQWIYVSGDAQPQQWKTRSGMGRFALVLTAIMLLIFSAGLTRDQSQAAPLSVGAPSVASFPETTDAFRAELMVVKRATTPPAAQRSPNEDLPALALLVYLALILVGSAGSVALARRRMR